MAEERQKLMPRDVRRWGGRLLRAGIKQVRADTGYRKGHRPSRGVHRGFQCICKGNCRVIRMVNFDAPPFDI